MVAAHRGHRLGLRMKLAMLEWLRAERRDVEVIDTWNVPGNAPMIAINDALGVSGRGRDDRLPQGPPTAVGLVVGLPSTWCRPASRALAVDTSLTPYIDGHTVPSLSLRSHREGATWSPGFAHS